MKLVDNIVQDIESAFEPLRSGNLDEQDFEIEIPFSKDNDSLWVSLNSELRSRGIAYDLLDTYEADRKTVYYVMLKRLWKPEYYNEGAEHRMKLTIKENAMGGNWPNVYLPREAKEYLRSKGWQEIDLPDLGPCFYMNFPGNDYWEIYIDQQYGGIYVVQDQADIVPTDDIGSVDNHSYRRDIDDLMTLGNCLSNGEDFNTCMNNWWGVNESTKRTKKKYVKEDLYHDAQKAVYDFFMKKQWDLNIPEVANYADAVAEQLELDPEFANGTYTMRDWYKDTYWSYPEEIEWLDSTAY